MRRSLLVLVCLLACAKDSSDGSEGTGEPCTYDCAGQACNLRCVDDVIFRCPPSEVWELEEDCVSKGEVCRPVYEENGMQVDIECGPPGEATDCGGPGSHSSIDEQTGECVCDPGFFWCDVDDPADYSCCVTDDVYCPDPNSHVTDTGQCVCDAGYSWCNPEDPSDLSCCEGDESGTGG